MTAPEPIAQGTLAVTPLAHVLLHLHQKSMSGTLAVWPDDSAATGQDRVLFERGTPVAARLMEQTSALDRGLLQLFHRGKAPYAFYDVNLVGSRPGVLRGKVDPLTLVAASLRGSLREDAVAKALDRFGTGRVRFRPVVDPQRFELSAKERAFLELLQAEPARVETLVASSGDPRLARRLLYLFAITRCLDAESGADIAGVRGGPADHPGPAPPPPQKTTQPGAKASSSGGQARAPGTTRKKQKSHPEPAPLPSPELSDAHRALWEELTERAATAETQNYFEMLGITETADTGSIQAAYVEQIKKWHPDRLPPELAPLRPTADRLFHYLTQAKETLSDKANRTAYIRNMKDGGGTPEADRKVSDLINAAMEFQKVEVLVRKKSWKEAREAVDMLLEENSEEPDYLAMRAWIAIHDEDLKQDDIAKRVLSQLNKALELHENHERAHMGMGIIQKRLGNGKRALFHFEQVHKLNPRNIEAAREVRLAGMRSKKAAGGEGLLSKLFGGKKK